MTVSTEPTEWVVSSRDKTDEFATFSIVISLRQGGPEDERYLFKFDDFYVIRNNTQFVYSATLDEAVDKAKKLIKLREEYIAFCEKNHKKMLEEIVPVDFGTSSRGPEFV